MSEVADGEEHDSALEGLDDKSQGEPEQMLSDLKDPSEVNSQDDLGSQHENVGNFL